MRLFSYFKKFTQRSTNIINYTTRALIYLLFILSIFTGVACSQAPKDVADEKKLTKAIDQFTNVNGEKWDDFEKMVASSPAVILGQRLEDFNNHPFIKAFNTFTQQHTMQYAAVRSAKFAQYAPPPALLALNWDTTGQKSPVSMFSNMELFPSPLLATKRSRVLMQNKVPCSYFEFLQYVKELLRS